MSRPRLEAWLWLVQRGSALAMLPLAAAHLALVMLAVDGGLTATQILDRTQGNIAVAVFYLAFVLCAGIHAALGLRSLCGEFIGWRGPGVDAAAALIGLALWFLGWRAVWAVVYA